MEHVTKMTYNDLFYLKKSLLETGQIVLANIVPVKTEPPLDASTSGLYPAGEHYDTENICVNITNNVILQGTEVYQQPSSEHKIIGKLFVKNLIN